MNNKRLIAAILLLMLLLAVPVWASAAESVTVEISFRVINAPSTVVMDAVDGAPAPEPGRFVNTTGDRFRISFTKAGTYGYRVYQEPGPDPDLEYDGVVYDVLVTVYEKPDGTLDTIVEAWIPGNDFKAMEIVFENPPGARIDKDQRLNNGVRTKKTVWGNPGDKITYYITVTNGGSNPVFDVIVTDGIPEGLLLVEDSISDGGSEEDGVIEWTLGDIAALGSKTVQFTVIVPNVSEPTTWTNVAEGSYVASTATRAGSSPRHELRTNVVEAIYEPDEPGETDKPTPTPTPGAAEPTPSATAGTDGSGSSNTPQTGDTSQLILWSALMGASLLGIVLCFFFIGRKKKDKSEE